jgi:tripartite-type tricarboxylate transporter receptor subunit TctC
MCPFTRRAIVGSALVTALSVSPLLRTAKAQTYPQRPVKIIVPCAAGGASDIIARLIAPELERALG